MLTATETKSVRERWKQYLVGKYGKFCISEGPFNAQWRGFRPLYIRFNITSELTFLTR